MTSRSQKTNSPGNGNSLSADLRKGRRALRAGIFLDNPIFCQLLGVCSALS